MKLYISLVCIGLCNIVLMASLLFGGKSITIVIYYPRNLTKKSSDIKMKTKDFKQEKAEEYSETLPMPPLPPIITENKIVPKPLEVIATAYCPCAKCCGKGSPGITKTGRSAWLPGVAVDPLCIPLGSHIDIPGYNRNNNGSWVLCDDTGGKIKGNRIDVRFKTHEEAKRWGRQKITIRVWSKK